MDIKKLSDEIIKGRRLKREEDLDFFINVNIDELCNASNSIREFFHGNQMDLCSIINGRSGGCSEDCKFCAQSAYNDTFLEPHEMLSVEELVLDCKRHEEMGIYRYSVVTSGRDLDEKALNHLCLAYGEMKKQTKINLCASHGLLGRNEFIGLKKSGVVRYHENIETSKRNFPNICTTHTYEDKINSIKEAKKAGLQICSGGIIGMGETFKDRLDMAISLSELKVESIPVNVLVPIPGSPFENMKPLQEEEILRTIAIFRFINPEAEIRLAAGRILMKNSGEKAFLSGANGAISGNLLTTSGNTINQDKAMLSKLGFELKI